jgi:replicative DNA helicase
MSKDSINVQASWYSRPTAERAVISLCLQSMTSFVEVSSKLAVEDFLDDSNRSIFTVLCNLAAMGIERFDLPTVASAVNDLSLLESIGGFAYLDALFKSDISKDNLNAYIKNVLDASMLFKMEKQLRKNASYVHNNGNMSEIDATAVVSNIEESILSLSLDTLKIEDGKYLSDGVLDLLREYESNPSVVRGLKTGFSILDRMLNGLVPGSLYVVAARPKCGKSLMLAQWAYNVCLKEKKPILYIDTEMTFKEDFQPRALSHLSSVPERIIKNGLYINNGKQKEAVYYAAELMSKMKFVHKYMPGFRMEDVKSLVRRYHAKEGIGALFFDYIKMVDLNEKFNETQTLGHITSTLKDLAGVLNIPVVTAVQINRTGEGKTRYNSSQIADSDRVLRYCNVLMALANKSKKEIDEDGIECGTHRLQILDNRSGSNFYSGIDLVSKTPILTMQEASTQSSDSLIEQKRIEEEKSM